MRSEYAITSADLLRPSNKIDISLKRRWLADIDRRIFETVILAYDGEERNKTVDFETYLYGDVELLVSEIYSGLYIWYLVAKIDSALGETEKYNISTNRYNSLYSDFRAWYTRTHKPFNKYRLKNTFKVGGI